MAVSYPGCSLPSRPIAMHRPVHPRHLRIMLYLDVPIHSQYLLAPQHTVSNNSPLHWM